MPVVRRVEYDLDNGEKVSCRRAVAAAGAFGDLTAATLNQVLDQIAARARRQASSMPPTKRGGSSRWCGQVLLDIAEMEALAPRQIIAQWLESGCSTRPHSITPSFGEACQACWWTTQRPTE